MTDTDPKKPTTAEQFAEFFARAMPGNDFFLDIPEIDDTQENDQ